jgi:hypothetical protein
LTTFVFLTLLSMSFLGCGVRPLINISAAPPDEPEVMTISTVEGDVDTTTFQNFLILVGKNFPTELSVQMLDGTSPEKVKHEALTLLSQSTTKLVVALPKSLKPGQYIVKVLDLLVPNAAAQTEVLQILQGERGATGFKGDKGDSGVDGAKGDKGDKGDTGAAGVPGSQGNPGAPGAQGIQGTAGASGTNFLTTASGNVSGGQALVYAASALPSYVSTLQDTFDPNSVDATYLGNLDPVEVACEDRNDLLMSYNVSAVLRCLVTLSAGGAGWVHSTGFTTCSRDVYVAGAGDSRMSVGCDLDTNAIQRIGVALHEKNFCVGSTVTLDLSLEASCLRVPNS